MSSARSTSLQDQMGSRAHAHMHLTDVNWSNAVRSDPPERGVYAGYHVQWWMRKDVLILDQRLYKEYSSFKGAAVRNDREALQACTAVYGPGLSSCSPGRPHRLDTCQLDRHPGPLVNSPLIFQQDGGIRLFSMSCYSLVTQVALTGALAQATECYGGWTMPKTTIKTDLIHKRASFYDSPRWSILNPFADR